MEEIDLNLPIEYFASSYRSFSDSDKLPRREAAGDIITLVLSGVLRFRAGDREIELCRGEYFVQRSGTVIEDVRPSEQLRFFFVHFRAHYREGEHTLPELGAFDADELAPVMSELDSLYRSEASYTAKCAGFYTLLSRIAPRQNDESLVGRVRRYLEREYVRFHSADELSVLFHYSKNHLINTFRNRYGMTPVEYANELRLARAAYLLETTMLSADEIASEVGFNHYSHFYRLFMRRYAKSPSKWRQDMRWLLT